MALYVKVNPLFKNYSKTFIDPLSKYYVTVECLLGLNRLPVTLHEQEHCFFVSSLAYLYSVALTCCLIYASYSSEMYTNFFFFVWTALFFKYIFCALFSFVTLKKLNLYYNEMSKFDDEIGCRPKTTSDSLWNLIITSTFTGLASLFHGYLTLFVWPIPIISSLPLNLITAVHCLEVSFHGHLLSLLAARVRLINYYMESMLSSGTSVKRPDIEEFVSFKSKNKNNYGMRKLMDLYLILIKAYDLLVDAIKWQLIVIIVASFIHTLAFCYGNAVLIFYGQVDFVPIAIGMVAAVLLPLFSPCMFGDRVHGEVRRLRELIASRLFENALVKADRNSARALLALTEARELSFSLLNMLQVDVSLPFKFIGLLVTYLIILIQFNKVIHPTLPAEST